LEITQLRKRYGAKVALDGISLTVQPGEMYGFVGANGAGKSTTMRIAMGVLAADAGTVRWQGQPIGLATRRRFGYMPEERGLYPKMRVLEQIEYFGRLHGMSAAAARESATHLLERMQIKTGPADGVQALSLGNQQRVQLAVALVHNPSLLILDEPFSGLDPIGVDTMAGLLTERCRQGVAVIFSSHQLELVERLCDRIGIIVGGSMVAEGTIGELRSRAGDRTLEVTVDAPDGRWLEGVPGVSVRSAAPPRFVLQLADPDSDQAVLAAAAGAGRVERFGWTQRPLAELYREAVADPGEPVAPEEALR
jgi:ABC-2 type transport system ATP-binding protein